MPEIRDAFPMSEWPTIRSFIERHYRPDLAVTSRPFFDWQFRCAGRPEAPILSAWSGGELDGILAYLAWPVFWGDPGKPVEAAWTLYWMVRPEAAKGLGWLLHRKIMERYPVGLTVNTSHLGGPLLKAMGWTLVERVPRRLFVLDQDACAPLLPPGGFVKDLAPFVFRPPRAAGAARGLPADELSYDPDWSLYPALAFGTVRSLDYLRWRYLKHPVFSYRVLTSGPARSPAVCVYRVERIFGAAQGRAGRIVDFFHPARERGREDGRAVLGAALRSMTEAGCAFADLVSSSAELNATAAGLGGAEEPPERQILPSRLTPLQHLRREQNLAWYAAKGLPRPAPDRIHCTRSDIDGDSPANRELPDARTDAPRAILEKLA